MAGLEVLKRLPQIENQQVVFMQGKGRVGIAAVADMVDRVARSAQRPAQPVSEHLIILGQQNPHTRSR